MLCCLYPLIKGVNVQAKNTARYILFFVLYLVFFIIALVYTLCEKFKVCTFEQILFHLTQPMGTTGPVFIKKIALNTSIESAVMFLLALCLAACLVFMLFFIMVKLRGFEYIRQALTPASTFYEKNKAVIADNDYGRFKSFFSNILCLPQILKNNGYRTYYLQGADLNFAGKDKVFSRHGFDEIYGWDEFKSRKDYRNSYNAYWSVNDNALFEYTKQKLLEMSKQKGPFLLSMLTADSHSPDCFLSGACEKKFKIKLENVLACTDAMIGEFVKGAKKQEFYRDTAIVILGGHLTMRNEYSEKLEPVKNRELVNIFINSQKTRIRPPGFISCLT